METVMCIDIFFYSGVDAVAKGKGISKSKLVSQAIIDSKIVAPPKKDDFKLRELQLKQELNKGIDRIGKNVNRISKHCNIRKHVDLAVLDKIANMERLLADVRQKI